ncbi:MAG: FAD-dependent monooxygenase [Bacteroidales bacterium]|nr:FAD-dependent monooxygenase [Bacteroidales bacterium]
MGYKEISIKMPTDYTDEQIKRKIERELGIKTFTFSVENKSLDARKKTNIHWLIRLRIFSDQIKGEGFVPKPELEIPYEKTNKKIVVVGSGPAGFFSALVLQKAGYHTILIERGTDVDKRSRGIDRFEATGVFNSKSNYAFGEGGAGTFSDGKLTSRSKHISQEKQFILSSYIRAGGPEEIAYMTHPHLGSDNLKIIVKNLRKEFQDLGGVVMFETLLEDVKIVNGQVTQAITDKGSLDLDYLVIASGHSSYETYRMLMRNGVMYRTKNFALGSRVEHSQLVINKAQWGIEQLAGVKAAEYRLTSEGDGNNPVYTFCMCPGGIVVPAAAYDNSNIVNGMSLYQRDNNFANAACVAGIHPDKLLGREVSPLEVLDWLQKLEQSFFDYSGSFKAPYCKIQDFINKKETKGISDSSYPLGLMAAPLWELLPTAVSNSMREGLKNFARKIRGYETGNIIGLESKTSAPIQVIRERSGLCSGFKNLYIVGEGSGYAGGIISSGADGIKAAMNIIQS